MNEDRVVTCYEMKDKRITRQDIDVALPKIAQSVSLDNYIFITTEPVDETVTQYARSLYNKTGVEHFELHRLSPPLFAPVSSV